MGLNRSNKSLILSEKQDNILTWNENKSTKNSPKITMTEIPIRTGLGQRYLALDVLRGMTIAFMIIVNTPGSWSHLYALWLMQIGMDLHPQTLFFLHFYLW